MFYPPHFQPKWPLDFNAKKYSRAIGNCGKTLFLIPYFSCLPILRGKYQSGRTQLQKMTITNLAYQVKQFFFVRNQTLVR